MVTDMLTRIVKLVIILAILLLSSHLLMFELETYYTFPMIVAIYILLMLSLKTTGDTTLNILVIYGMAHFSFLDNFGTIAPWLTFIYLIVLWIEGRHLPNNRTPDTLMVLSVVFIVLNLFGLILLNPNGMYSKITGFISLIGMVLLLVFISKRMVSSEDIKLVIVFFGLCCVYMFITQLNSYFQIIVSETPLLTVYGNISLDYQALAIPMFGRASGEYYLCMNVFFLSLLLNDNTFGLNLNKYYLLFVYLVSFIGCLLVYSKSQSTLLVISNSLLYFRYLSVLRVKRYAFVLFLLVISLIVLSTISDRINIIYVIERFRSQPDLVRNIYSNPLLAEGTSRDDSFYWGYSRNIQRNWFIGYGWHPADKNASAYFHGSGINIPKYDFHNLYYSLSPVFGWFGALLIVFLLLRMVLISYRLSRNKKLSYLRIIGLSFFACFLVFLLGEYSINALSESNYVIILIVWTGLVNSIYYSSKNRRFLYDTTDRSNKFIV